MAAISTRQMAGEWPKIGFWCEFLGFRFYHMCLMNKIKANTITSAINFGRGVQKFTIYSNFTLFIYTHISFNSFWFLSFRFVWLSFTIFESSTVCLLTITQLPRVFMAQHPIT